MPLHRIFHTPGTFNQAHKDELAKRISDLYASFGLPPFYVVVLFIPVEKTDFCVDRKQNIKKFIRTGIQHIARHLSTFAHVQLFFAKYEVVLALFIKNCRIDVCDPNLWRELGLVLSIPGRNAEKEWNILNNAIEILCQKQRAATVTGKS
ncbi:Tautomerase-3 domain-containing protein [Aphelenchoides besseyi]|nr:Tautomerase-3 domain-containing protein [Aphelenchoides besseyi]